MRPSSYMQRRSRARLSAAAQPTSESLERWKAISSIAAAVAIPIVLALTGYFVQRQLADEGLKKDYVAIATGILKEDPSTQEEDLRKWAVAILESNSPIPFSAKTKEGLERGTLSFQIRPARMPPPPELCMKPPSKPRIAPLIERLAKVGIPDVQQLAKQYDELVVVALKAEEEAEDDRGRLVCLQSYGRLVIEAEAETDAMYSGRAGPTAREPKPKGP